MEEAVQYKLPTSTILELLEHKSLLSFGKRAIVSQYKTITLVNFHLTPKQIKMYDFLTILIISLAVYTLALRTTLWASAITIMRPVVPQTSTTNSNQQRDDEDYHIWLRLFDLMTWLLPLTALAWALSDDMRSVAKSIMHFVIDNIYPLLLASIAFWILCEYWILCDCLDRVLGKNPQTRKNTDAPAENKAEQEFLTKARELREKVYQLAVAANASKNTAAPLDNNAEDEVLTKMHEVQEKVYQLVVASDARSKDTSAESVLLSPSVFAGVMDIILYKEAHFWRKIEPELVAYLQNVTKDEDGWEWV
jgi:hypothetical protein